MHKLLYAIVTIDKQLNVSIYRMPFSVGCDIQLQDSCISKMTCVPSKLCQADLVFGVWSVLLFYY